MMERTYRPASVLMSNQNILCGLIPGQTPICRGSSRHFIQNPYLRLRDSADLVIVEPPPPKGSVRFKDDILCTVEMKRYKDKNNNHSKLVEGNQKISTDTGFKSSHPRTVPAKGILRSHKPYNTREAKKHGMAKTFNDSTSANGLGGKCNCVDPIQDKPGLINQSKSSSGFPLTTTPASCSMLIETPQSLLMSRKSTDVQSRHCRPSALLYLVDNAQRH